MFQLKQILLIKSLLFILLSICSSCSKNKINDDVEKPVKDSIKETLPPIISNKIVFDVIFEGVPNNATVAPAKLKFNKDGWVSAEWDDNSVGALQGFEKLKTTFYTDGCGNNISYAAALAVNGRSQYNNAEIATNENSVTYSQMKTLIDNGWDIENHSYYHEPTGNYNFGTDRDKNVKELDDLIYQNTKYKLNGLVVPTNHDGFPTAAKKIGYLFSTSQGTFDGFAPGGKPVYKDVQDFDLAPQNFSSFNRIFYDDWVSLERDVKNAIEIAKATSNSYFRFGSHTIDKQAFTRIIDYFKNTTDDKILFISTREAMEYRLMSSLPITYIKEGNKIKVTIDMSTLPERVRWRDLSFLVKSDKKIVDVKLLSSEDKTSFNSSVGLVNVFRQLKNW